MLPENKKLQPRISLIVPVFNQEDHLGRCLDSILQQEFSEFEIILIDDASTDYTPEVCTYYAKLDSRIQVITNTSNKGQGYSRNLALLQARSKYVTFVDSDDYIEKPLLKTGVEVLEQFSEVDIVIFNRYDVDTKGNKTGEQSFKANQELGKTIFENFCFGKVPSFGPVAKVYRKSMLEKFHIEFPSYMWEDNLFTLKAYFYAHKIYFTDIHGYTRVHQPHLASAMNPYKITPRHISGICQLVKDIHIFFSSLDIRHMEEHEKYFSKHFLKRFKTFFSYILTCYEKKFDPFRQYDIQCLSNAPYFIEAIIDDYNYISEKKHIDSNISYKNFIANEDNICNLLRNYIYMIQTNTLEENHIKDKKDNKSTFYEVQMELKTVALEKSLCYKLGSTILDNASSLHQILILPLTLFKVSKFYSIITAPPSLGGKEFTLLKQKYDEEGFTKTHIFLQKMSLPPKVLGNAYTALARHVMKCDIKSCAAFSKLAYQADPQPYRLKWMTFRFYKAGDIMQAAAMYDLLPKDTMFKGEEARIVSNIKTKVLEYKNSL